MSDKNSIELNISIRECDRRAEELFLRRAGLFSTESGKHRRMREEAFCVRESLKDSIKPKAVYSFCENFQLKGKILIIEFDYGYAEGAESEAKIKEKQRAVSCNAFEQIDPSSVKGIYLYGVTAGEIEEGDRYSQLSESLSWQLYRDMWGTAYVDAAREILTDELRGNLPEGHRLSESFGPGFYGMDVAEMVKLAELTDLKSIGVKAGDSGLLMPEKSCAGIFLVAGDGYRDIDHACEACIGNKKSCRLCSLGKVRAAGQE